MPTPRDLLAFCASHEAWLHDTIDTLVRIESPTDDVAAVNRCGEAVAARLEAIGATVERIAGGTAGDHLKATVGSGGRRVLLLGHFDTVWPIGQLDRMPIRQTEGRWHGPGILDMKAGLSMGMLAARAVHARAPEAGRIVLLWTTDEETGSRTSRALIEAEARQSDAVLVLEPALRGGALKTSRKGIGQYRVEARGVAAHAGVDPASGVSAVRELARQILALEALHDLDRGVSVNAGVVHGGTRPNVVPEQAVAIVDVRAPSLDEAARIDRTFAGLTAQLPGASLHVSGGFERPPMERSAGVAWLYGLATEVAGELGQPIAEGGTGGGSDGNFTAALGVPTLDGLGATGDGAHALHEHIELATLVPRTGLLAGLIARVLAS